MHTLNRRQFTHVTARTTLAALPLAVFAPFASQAQTIEALKIVCGFPPGGTADTISRRVAEKMGGRYAKAAVVENRTGAGGQIALTALKTLPADGSAIVMSPASMLMIYPHIYKKLPYDVFGDVTPLSLAATFDHALAVGPLVPASVKTVPEFIAWAKANPALGNYGTPAAGSVPHFLGELISRAGAADLRHVPYRGSQPAVLEMIGGQLSAVSAPVGEFLQHVPTGKVRILGTSGAQRTRFTPNVPTYVEQGYKDIAFSEWFGFFGPGKLPADVAAKLTAALRESIATKEVVDGFALMGLDARASSAPELAALLKTDHDRWGPVVKQIGFTAES